KIQNPKSNYISAMRRLFILTVVPLLLAACASTPRAPIDLSNADVIDLTYSFDEHTLYWPNSPSNFELKRLAYGKTPAGYFYASNSFCAPEHGGTHLDAPLHFADGRRAADQIPVRQPVAPAVVIDVRAEAARDPDYRLTAADVARSEGRHGAIEKRT